MMNAMSPKQLSPEVAVDVVSAQSRGGFRLLLTFSDGVEREIDFEPFLRGSPHPQIKGYLDPVRFAKFRVVDGELIWG